MWEKDYLQRESDEQIAASIQKIKLREAAQIIQEAKEKRQDIIPSAREILDTFYPETWTPKSRSPRGGVDKRS